MARMVPMLDDLELREIPSAAERSVYVAFGKGLPDEHLVVHSLQIVGTTSSGVHDDMESDFVEFAPESGFLVVEVKGGGIEFEGSTGKWFSTNRQGRHSIKDPFKQAQRNKREILRSLKASQNWGADGSPRILAGHAVLFPDVDNERALAGPGRPLELIGGRSAIADPAGWIRSVFHYWAHEDRSWSPLGARGMSVVESLFCSKVCLKAPLALHIEREYQRQIELTDRQARVLRMLSMRYRAAIAGGAGTGKTLLALRHAKELAGGGIKTLFVCYNQMLGDFLKKEAQGTENLHVMTFHELCSWRVRTVKAMTGTDLLAEAKQMYPGEPWAEVQLPYALARSADFDKVRYQAIIVDEGQDFGDEWWLGLELQLEDRDDSHFYVFYDPNQAIYRKSESFPIKDPPLCLTENCRNTRFIHESAYRHYSGYQIDPPDIEGEAIVTLTAPDIRSQAKLVRKIVSGLVSEEKVPPADIAVLIMPEGKNAYYAALQELPAPTGAKWSFETLWESGAVLVDTARRFKGLEAAVVILWGMDRLDETVHRELIYVSLSRARSRVWIVEGPVSAPMFAQS